MHRHVSPVPIGQLRGDVAPVFKDPILDTVGRSPQLGAPGRHGRRKELRGGMLDGVGMGFPHIRSGPCGVASR